MRQSLLYLTLFLLVTISHKHVGGVDTDLSFLPCTNCQGIQLPGMLSVEKLRGASFEIVMMDDRPLPDDTGDLDFTAGQPQWALTAMLNCAYAMHFGYKFRYVNLNRSRMDQEYHAAWHKIFYVAHRLRYVKASSTSSRWLLLLDSDAHVRQFDAPLHEFLGGLGLRYGIHENVGVIMTRDMSLPGLYSSPLGIRWLNTGVMFINMNVRSKALFNIWLSAGRQANCLKKQWPYENGIFQEMLFPNSLAPLREDERWLENCPTQDDSVSISSAQRQFVQESISEVSMIEMNSPWGRFIQHIWSGQGSYLKTIEYQSAFIRLCGMEIRRMQYLLDKLHQHVVAWGPQSVQP